MKKKHLLIIIIIVSCIIGLYLLLSNREGESGSPRLLYTLDEGLKEPSYAASDNEGKIYVSDSGNRRVAVFSDNGKYLYEIGGAKSGKPLIYPYGVGILEDSVLVADSGAGALYEYSLKGNYQKTWISSQQGIQPGQIFVKKKKVYLTDMAGKKILVFDQQGKILSKIQSKKVGIGSPQGLSVDSDGSAWVADAANYNVKLISPTGELKAIFDGGPQQALTMAKGLAVDSDNRIYVADTLSNVIRIFDKNGNNLLSLGVDGGNKSKFSVPVGLYIDDEDNIYVADQGNNMIQVWSLKD